MVLSQEEELDEEGGFSRSRRGRMPSGKPNPVDVQVPREVQAKQEDEIKPTPEQRPATKSAPPVPKEAPKVAETPKPRAPTDPAFSGFQRKTAVVGSISRTGRSSLDVEDSPLGRYQAAISRAVEQEWQRNCVRHRDFITPGFLTVRFYVEPSGRVRSGTCGRPRPSRRSSPRRAAARGYRGR